MYFLWLTSSQLQNFLFFNLLTFSPPSAPPRIAMFANIIKSSARSSLKTVAPLRRSLHTVPRIRNQELYQQKGIPGLYSSQGFRDVWSDYQQALVDDLSRATAETENETRTPFAIMLNTAKDQLQAATFNFASQAHNNHMFVQALTDATTNETKPSLALKTVIERDFGSLEELKAQIFSYALSSYGNGWLFLIEDQEKRLYLQFSYAAGNPYFLGRAQTFDLNIPMDAEVERELRDTKADIDSNARPYPVPLIALNLWENAYLADYGVAGKEQYLNKVWDALNWDVISERLFIA